MKSKLAFLLVLAAVFLAFVGVRFFVLGQQNVNGRLKIISSPTASVFVNNLAVGKTPYEDKYKVGEYIVKLIPEGNATETASWQGKVRIYKNALSYVNRELGSSDITSGGEVFTTTKMETSPKSGGYGEIYIETEPQGAIVNLDNDEKGVAPLILSDVLKGEHEISVYMPGFFRRTQKINIDPGFRVNAFFKLAIDQSQKTLAPTGIPEDKKEATASASTGKTMIVINETPTGWLRVREEPSITASEAARVKPGEKFELLDEDDGWYKIEYEKEKEGWISGEYATKE
jgi:hypothetical protein